MIVYESIVYGDIVNAAHLVIVLFFAVMFFPLEM
jgi:hypothetical protein